MSKHLEGLLIQAGRILAGLSPEQLASLAKVPEDVVADTEAGRDVTTASLRAIRQALKSGGVFISVGDGVANLSVIRKENATGVAGEGTRHVSKYDRQPRTPRQQEHYDVAASFGRPFTPEEFREQYRRRYPNRPLTGILPADFSLPSSPSTAELPKFLRRRGGFYELIPVGEEQ